MCRLCQIIAIAIPLAVALPANAESFREGLIASTGKDGGEVVAFAFVECEGALMFEFAKDKKLNKIHRRNDGSLRVKFNHNKSELTIYDDGRVKNKKGETQRWRLLEDRELIGPLSKRLAKAREKCG